MRRLVVICAAIAVAEMASAHSSSIYTISPKMRDDVACMYAVLKQTHGIDQVKLGAVEWQDWVYPYLEYRAAPAPDGYRYVVRYVAQQDCTNVPYEKDGIEDFRCVPRKGPYSFMTVLPGLSAMGTEPSDWGTRALEKKWKTQCGVEAWALFE